MKIKNFRLRMSEYGKSIGLNLMDLSIQLNISYQTILYWNQGRSRPTLEGMLELMDLTGWSFQDLIELEHCGFLNSRRYDFKRAKCIR